MMEIDQLTCPVYGLKKSKFQVNTICKGFLKTELLLCNESSWRTASACGSAQSKRLYPSSWYKASHFKQKPHLRGWGRKEGGCRLISEIWPHKEQNELISYQCTSMAIDFCIALERYKVNTSQSASFLASDQLNLGGNHGSLFKLRINLKPLLEITWPRSCVYILYTVDGDLSQNPTKLKFTAPNLPH